jgi:hypothetical protein
MIFRWIFYRYLPSQFTSVAVAQLGKDIEVINSISTYLKHILLLSDTLHTLGIAKSAFSPVIPAFASFDYNIQADFLIYSNIFRLVKSTLF